MKHSVIILLCLAFGLMALTNSRNGEASATRAVPEVEPKQPTFQGQVLFVEDPGNPGFGPATKPDPNWTQLLDEIYGSGNYDWFGATVDPNENGPDYATMSSYPLVIWNCYDYWWGSGQGQPPCLTTTDQNEIANYILDGNSFWLIGQDAHWSGVPDPWLNTYFYSQSVTDDYAWNVSPVTENGLNELAGITCTFTTDYQSNSFFPDNITPATGAHHILEDNDYPGNFPAIIYPGNDYKTTYWAIDGRSPDNWDNWKAMVEAVLGVLGVAEERPAKVSLLDFNIHPNPTNRQFTVSYQLAEKGHTSLVVYDQAGRNVRTIIDAVQNPGSHAISARTKGLANGVYFLRLETDDMVSTKQLIILR